MKLLLYYSEFLNLCPLSSVAGFPIHLSYLFGYSLVYWLPCGPALMAIRRINYHQGPLRYRRHMILLVILYDSDHAYGTNALIEIIIP